MATIAELSAVVSAELETAGFQRAEAAIMGIASVAKVASAQASQSINQIGDAMQSTAGRYTDAAGRLREANGRFVSAATLATEAAQGLGNGLGATGGKSEGLRTMFQNLATTVNGKLASAFDTFEQKREALESGIGRLGSGLKDIGGGLTTFLTLPLGLVAGVSLKTAGDMQALRKGFEAVYNGAGDVNAELGKLKEVAKLPGLGLKEAIQGSVNLQAVGFSAEQARKTLTAFGNALATTGGGKNDLEEVARQLGQIKSVGKVTDENLNVIKERAPLIAKAIEKAFDGATTSEQLRGMGVDAEKFIVKVTDQLATLPSVSGGINNAFENASDVVTNALDAIGTAINKNFDIEGIINQVSDAVSGLIDSFNELSPTTQKIIIGVAGFAALAGPLVFAIGAITAAIPTLVAGMSAIGAAATLATGPIGLIVAGVALAAIVIIKNWDKIVSYFTSGAGSQVFASLSDTASAALDAVVALFEQGVALITAVWEKIEPILSGVLGYAMDKIVNIVRVGLDVLRGVFELLTGLITLDFEKMGEGIRTIFGTLFNNLIDIVSGQLTGLVGIFAAGLEKLGIGEAISKQLRQAQDSILSFANSLHISTAATKEATAELAKMGETGAASANKLAEALAKPVPLLERQNQLLKEQQAIRDAATDEKTLASANARIELIQKEIDRLESLGVKGKNSLELVIAEIEKYNAVLANPDSSAKAVANAQKMLDKLYEQKDVLERIIALNIGQAGKGQGQLTEISRFDKVSATDRTKFDSLGGTLTPNAGANVDLSGKSDEIDAQITKINAKLAEGRKEVLSFGAEFESAMDQAASAIQGASIEIVSGFAEILAAQAITGDGFSNLPTLILGTIGNLATQLGKIALGVGIGIESIRKSLSTLTPQGALIAGAALIALGAAAKAGAKSLGSGGGGVTPFANGGLVFGPTLSLIGEGKGTTRSNPEVVAPLDKLKNFMGGSDMEVSGQFRIEGDALVATVEKTLKRQGRSSGKGGLS